jgi:hypothetical protein
MQLWNNIKQVLFEGIYSCKRFKIKGKFLSSKLSEIK